MTDDNSRPAPGLANRWQRFAEWDERPLRLDKFAAEDPAHGFAIGMAGFTSYAETVSVYALPASRQNQFRPRGGDPGRSPRKLDKWVPFLNTYRTMCIALEPEF